jgi:hypothetical protein
VRSKRIRSWRPCDGQLQGCIVLLLEIINAHSADPGQQMRMSWLQMLVMRHVMLII